MMEVLQDNSVIQKLGAGERKKWITDLSWGILESRAAQDQTTTSAVRAAETEIAHFPAGGLSCEDLVPKKLKG